MQEALGVAGRVEAHLYKLLLYETDGHFAKHKVKQFLCYVIYFSFCEIKTLFFFFFFKFVKDTEKENGHFGSLLITLPSNFTGGSLLCEHDGKQLVFDFASLAASRPCCS